MRRWVCIITLLAAFSGDQYAWTARPRIPVPVVRQLEPAADRRSIAPTGTWWLRS
jgi:hypothetical protein